MRWFGWLREPEELTWAETNLRWIGEQLDDAIDRNEAEGGIPSDVRHPYPDRALELAGLYLSLASTKTAHRSVVVAVAVSMASLLVSAAAVVVAVIAL